MNKLAKEIAIEEHCFTYDNVLYERLYNHSHKYRFFFDEESLLDERSWIIQVAAFERRCNDIVPMKI